MVGTPLPAEFENYYTLRHPEGAPALDERFDEAGQAIYAGFDPKTVYKSPKQETYPDVPAAEHQAIADALNDHGTRAMRLARMTLPLGNMVWLGLKGGNNEYVMRTGVAAETRYDEFGSFTRISATDIGVVAPRNESSQPTTLAMGVADCLAIPVVDTRTGAFALAHAGRPGTSLHTAEKAADLLTKEFRSKPEDLVAYLGQGICDRCHTVDERGVGQFIENFGGKSEVAKVTEQYPGAITEFEQDGQRRYSIDLYAFNQAMLTPKVGEITVQACCTARVSGACLSVEGEAPPEADQPYYSHMRVKSGVVGWRMADGELAQYKAADLGTPRNLAMLTRA